MLRVKFFGEGVHDVGRHLRSNECAPIQALVINVLKKYCPQDFHFSWESHHIKKLETHGTHGTVIKRKIERAIGISKQNGFRAAVFVVDHDLVRNELKTIVEMKSSPSSSFPLVLGVAIMKFEAWLLADNQARRNILGKKGGDDLGKIEDIRDPKIIFDSLFGNLKQQGCSEATQPEWYIRLLLAKESNVETIAKECQKGFKPFLNEIKRHLVPLFSQKPSMD